MRRISTGIAELDLILQGGLMPGSLTVLAGAPGSGKTILARQVCFANAHPDAKAISYTALSEPHSKLVDHLEGFFLLFVIIGLLPRLLFGNRVSRP